MQTAGMLRGTRAVYLLAHLTALIGHAHSVPLQLLPSIPGYIPVYIRYGDQPLEEINPALAEAFHEKPSLPKSVRLDDLPGDADLNPEEQEVFPGKTITKTLYPVHARQTEDADDVEDVEAKQEPQRLLSIYELRDHEGGTNAEGHRGHSRRIPHEKSKLSSISKEEKDELKRLAIEVEREETRPNDMYDTSSTLPEPQLGSMSKEEKDELKRLAIEVEREETRPNDMYDADSTDPEPQAEASHHRGNNGHRLVPVVKLERVATEESSRKSPTIDEPPEPSRDRDVEGEKRKRIVVKKQRPAGFLSNVHKLTPIDFPKEDKESLGKEGERLDVEGKEEESTGVSSINDGLSISENTDIGTKSIIGVDREIKMEEKAQGTLPMREDKHSIDEKEEKIEVVIKKQRPAGFLSNVHKLTPIDFPKEDKESLGKEDERLDVEGKEEESTGVSSINDGLSIRENTDIGTKSIIDVHKEIKMEEEAKETLAMSENEDSINEREEKTMVVIKKQRPAGFLSNVHKLTPIDFPKEDKESLGKEDERLDVEVKNEESTEASLTNDGSSRSENVDVGTKSILHVDKEIEMEEEASKATSSINENKPSIDEKETKSTVVFKKQRPPGFLSNVHKLSPIDFPKEDEQLGIEVNVEEEEELSRSENTDIATKSIIDINTGIQVEKEESKEASSTSENKPSIDEKETKSTVVFKKQRPAGFLSNVHKLSPIDFPKEDTELLSKEDGNPGLNVEESTGASSSNNGLSRSEIMSVGTKSIVDVDKE